MAGVHLQLVAALGIALVTVATPSHAALRVVTFNTAMGLRSAERAQELFRDEPSLRHAHILSLQELCLNEPQQLSAYLSVVQGSHGRQYHYTDYASRSRGKKCDTGQAIVSAYPIRNAGTLRLPSVGADRVAVWVDIGVEGPGYRQLRVYNLHLSNRKGSNYVPVFERARQAEPVIEHALSFMREHPRAPILVTGDFNALGHLSDPSEREAVIELFQRYFQASERSFSSTFVVPYQLDWVFYVNLELLGAGSSFNWLSDHHATVADFRL